MQQIASSTNPFRLARQVRQEVGQWLEAYLIYEDQAWADTQRDSVAPARLLKPCRIARNEKSPVDA